MRNKLFESVLVTLAGGIILLAIEYYVFSPRRQGALNDSENNQKYTNSSPKPINPDMNSERRRVDTPQEQIQPRHNPTLTLSDESKVLNEENRVNELQSMINEAAVAASNERIIAIAIKADDRLIELKIEGKLANLIQSDKYSVNRNYFKDSFTQTGIFDRALKADVQILKQLTTLPKTEYYLLGELTYSFRQDTDTVQDLISCDLQLAYVLLNGNGSIVESNVISSIGPGFTRNSALERGIEILLETHSNKILDNFN